MKLKNVQAYPIDGVPDHIIEECCGLAKRFCLEIKPLIDENPPNLVLGALAFMHASFIGYLVSDDPEQQKKASEIAAIAIIKNVQILSGIKDEL